MMPNNEALQIDATARDAIAGLLAPLEVPAALTAADLPLCTVAPTRPCGECVECLARAHRKLSALVGASLKD